MAQYDVHRNTSPRTSRSYPFVIDVQIAYLRRSRTRLVVPLVPPGKLTDGYPIHPEFTVEDRVVILSPLEMFNIPVDRLGPIVASLLPERDRILRAIDFVLTGA